MAVKFVFVAEGEASFCAAKWAESWGWDFVKFSGEGWRNFFVKFFVSVGDEEILGAVFAEFNLQRHFGYSITIPKLSAYFPEGFFESFFNASIVFLKSKFSFKYKSAIFAETKGAACEVPVL